MLIDVDELDSPRHLGFINFPVMTGAIVARRRHFDGLHNFIEES